MNGPFGFGRRAKTERLLSDIRARLEEMETRFRRVEESLSRAEAKPPQQPHFQIENVHIHQPVLEKLEFRLDALDIEQLSGSLNLGNNFGAKWASGHDSQGRAAASGSGAGGNGSVGSGTGRSGTGRSGTGGSAAGGSGSAPGKSEGKQGKPGSGMRPSGGTASIGSESTDDGLRRTPSGYSWNNRR